MALQAAPKSPYATTFNYGPAPLVNLKGNTFESLGQHPNWDSSPFRADVAGATPFKITPQGPVFTNPNAHPNVSFIKQPGWSLPANQPLTAPKPQQPYLDTPTPQWVKDFFQGQITSNPTYIGQTQQLIDTLKNQWTGSVISPLKQDIIQSGIFGDSLPQSIMDQLQGSAPKWVDPLTGKEIDLTGGQGLSSILDPATLQAARSNPYSTMEQIRHQGNLQLQAAGGSLTGEAGWSGAPIGSALQHRDEMTYNTGLARYNEGNRLGGDINTALQGYLGLLGPAASNQAEYIKSAQDWVNYMLSNNLMTVPPQPYPRTPGVVPKGGQYVPAGGGSYIQTGYGTYGGKPLY